MLQRPQILIFSYHKTGTVLFRSIMLKLSARLGLRMEELFGMVDRVPPEIDIAAIGHSLLRLAPARPFRAIRVLRDPRDIWVSSYLYHRRCAEPWCRNIDFDVTPPIIFPRVPAAFMHRRERWKRDYLDGLQGRSYQQNLLELDRDAGLAFERARYTGCTMEDIRSWWLKTPDVMDLQLEEISRNFDATMRRVFTHLGLAADEIDIAMAIAATEDIGRMDDASIEANPHIYARDPSKFRSFLTPSQIADFEKQYGDIITATGYALSPSTP